MTTNGQWLRAPYLWRRELLRQGFEWHAYRKAWYRGVPLPANAEWCNDTGERQIVEAIASGVIEVFEL